MSIEISGKDVYEYYDSYLVFKDFMIKSLIIYESKI